MNERKRKKRVEREGERLEKEREKGEERGRKNKEEGIKARKRVRDKERWNGRKRGI